MTLELGKVYETKSGDLVVIHSELAGKEYIGRFMKARAEGHEVLQDKHQIWLEDGSWKQLPTGSIHDIVRESVREDESDDK